LATVLEFAVTWRMRMRELAGPSKRSEFFERCNSGMLAMG
jgi:hypothetical protein